MGNLPSIIEDLVSELESLSLGEKINAINEAKIALHEASPFSGEPVDCVLWVMANEINANDYNPNAVAPPEMRLLEHSVETDHFTQPIVTWKNGGGELEIVDGFHRNLVGRKRQFKKRLYGYLPVTTVNSDRAGRNDRIAATIRHNRARGVHQVDNMSEIVVELSRRNWSDKRIGKELGMEPDEVLRLKQISGLAELFSDKEFSEAWEIKQ